MTTPISTHPPTHPHPPDHLDHRTAAPEVSNVTAATPPVMIAQNEDDPSAHVENSLMFYYHLKRSTGRKASSALHL
jgi:dipeptidyl aminopeptidase/acylaminoacyl peptidase